MADKRKIRTRSVLGSPVPKVAKTLIRYYVEHCIHRTVMEVDELPKSVNHQYIRGRDFSGKANTRLHPQIKMFRQMVAYAINKRGWQPVGVTAAVILFETPDWITKAHTVRKMDSDNRVKPVFDAIELATGVPDQTNWQVHFFKVVSKRIRTTAYLFDLGDIVDVYG